MSYEYKIEEYLKRNTTLDNDQVRGVASFGKRADEEIIQLEQRVEEFKSTDYKADKEDLFRQIIDLKNQVKERDQMVNRYGTAMANATAEIEDLNNEINELKANQ